MSLLLHKNTKQQIDDFINKPSHAVGIFAPKGSGKKTVALHIAQTILNRDLSKNSAHTYIVRPNEKNIISIDDIREIIKFIKLKAIGNQPIKRTVLIYDADTITIEAQNALLKSLEEPSIDTVIIMTASDSNSLLPTIISRINKINVINPSKAEAVNHLKNAYMSDDIEKFLLMSNGRIGLAVSLLESKDHVLMPYIQTAKQIIMNDPYQRLILVDTLTKQNIKLILDALYIIATAGFRKSAADNQQAQNKWHHMRKCIIATQQQLSYNPNNRLLLCNLFLTM